MNKIDKLKGDKAPLIVGNNSSEKVDSIRSSIDTLWRKVANLDYRDSENGNSVKNFKNDLSEKLVTKRLTVTGSSVTENLYVNGTTSLYDDSSIDGDLTVSGNITASGNVDVKSILNVSGISNLFNVLNSNSSINISGNSSISGTTNNYGNVYNRSESYFGNVSGGDYTKFENDGTMVAEGDAMVYEDLNFDVLNSGGPAAYVPDYVEINNVIYREFTSANNQYCGAVKEIPHAAYMSGQTLTPHCHIFLKSGESSGTTGVTFKLNWDLRYNSTNVSGNIDITATSDQLAASGNILRLYGASGFACSTTTGGQLAMKIARVSGDAGDVIVTTYGVHVAYDMFGSRSINSK